MSKDVNQSTSTLHRAKVLVQAKVLAKALVQAKGTKVILLQLTLAQLNSSLQRDGVVDGGVQIQGQGGGHPGQIRRTEQKPGPKIHGKVGPVGGTGKHQNIEKKR